MPSVVMVNAVCSGSHGRIMSDIGRVGAGRGLPDAYRFCARRGQRSGPHASVRLRDVYLHVAATRLLDRTAAPPGARRSG